MRSAVNRRTLFTIALISTIATCRPAGSTPAERDARVVAEIARLESVLKALEGDALPKDVQPLAAQQLEALGVARRAKNPEYRLYRLRDSFVGIETLSFLAKQEASGQSVEKFRELWIASRPRFEAAVPAVRGTVLERALAESAATRAERLFRASLPYSKASAPWSGVYYLGEAEGNLRFRDFVRSLAAGEGGEPEKGASRERLLATLDSLERDTLKFFGGDVTNQKLIAVSVRLKEAGELLEAGRLDGAALLLVEARLALSRRGGPRGTYPEGVTAGRGSVASMLDGWAGDEEPPMAEMVRVEVMPFFGTLLLPAQAPRRGPSTVTVTLVRWPYT